MMRAGWIVAASLGLAAGCGGKEPEAALDYGAEDAIESKAEGQNLSLKSTQLLECGT